jgi:hypothetical protein
VADEATVRKLERYLKSGSGKAFANKRLWQRHRQIFVRPRITAVVTAAINSR